jgi:hypothetical protein
MAEKTLKERWNSKTPKFWKKVQKIAIISGVIAGAIISAPFSLPVGLVTAATYIATVSTTVATVAQLTVEDKAPEQNVNL